MHSYSLGADPVTAFQNDLLLPMLFGWMGVDFFFVLSGFLITGILIETRQEKQFLKKFYVRRTLRIFPLYYFVLFSYIVADQVFQLSQANDSGYVFHLFYLTNWDRLFGFDRPYALNHLWSLGIEEQFYLFWPAIFLMLNSHKKIQIFCACAIVFSMVLRGYSASQGHLNFAYDNTLCRLDGLMTGALLASLIRSSDFRIKLSDVCLYCILGLSVCVFIFLHKGHFFSLDPLVISFGLPALHLVFGSCILFVFLLRESHAYRRILSFPVLAYLGRISYGIYVYHWFVMLALDATGLIDQEALGYFGAQLVFFALSAAVTVAVASLSYYAMEKPILGLKDRYAPYEKKGEN